MKVEDVAIRLQYACQRVKVVDAKTRRICFEGTADELLDYSGANYRRITGISIEHDVLVLTTRV